MDGPRYGRRRGAASALERLRGSERLRPFLRAPAAFLATFQRGGSNASGCPFSGRERSSRLAAAATAEGPRALPELPRHPRVVLVPVGGTIDSSAWRRSSRGRSSGSTSRTSSSCTSTRSAAASTPPCNPRRAAHSKAKTVAFVNARAISAGRADPSRHRRHRHAPPARPSAPPRPCRSRGRQDEAPVEAKVVSYFRKEMKRHGRGQGPPRRHRRGHGRRVVEIAGLDGKDTTLTLTTTEAPSSRSPPSDMTAAIEASCERQLHRAGRDDSADADWAERLARFLSDRRISSLLMTLGMLGILIELCRRRPRARRLVAGLACLRCSSSATYVTNLAGWEELLLFVAGARWSSSRSSYPATARRCGRGVCHLSSLVMALLNLKRSRSSLPGSRLGAAHALDAGLRSILLATALGITSSSGSFPPPASARRSSSRRDHRARHDRRFVEIGRHGVTDDALRPAGKVDHRRQARRRGHRRRLRRSRRRAGRAPGRLGPRVREVRRDLT